MHVIIRTDSSRLIGSGHLMRCLTLADALAKGGANITLVCRDLEGNCLTRVTERGHSLITLPVPKHKIEQSRPDHPYDLWLEVSQQQEATETEAVLASFATQPEWLIVDHYALDEHWENAMKPHVRKLMVIDDLANRAHKCDLLLDQNLHEQPDLRYRSLTPDDCEVLMGPQYALLGDEFVKERETLRNRDGTIRRVLVFFGANDSTNETEKAVTAISRLDRSDIQFDVIIGSSNARSEQITSQCSSMDHVQLHDHVDNMAEYMARSDLALGASGTTAWERCYLGLPALAVQVAANQKPVLGALAAAGAVWSLGPGESVQTETYRTYLQKAISHPALLVDMSRRALDLMSPTVSSGKAWVAARILEHSHVGPS